MCSAFGRLWYGGPEEVANAIAYAEHYSRSYDAVIRVYDAAGNVMETLEHKGEFEEQRLKTTSNSCRLSRVLAVRARRLV